MSSPTGSRARAGAWLWCAMSVGVAMARVVLAVVDPASSDASSAPSVPGGGLPIAVFEAVMIMAIAILGAVVASRQPRNPVGWVLCAIAFFLGILIFGAHLFWALYLHDRAPTGGALFVAWLASWIWIPAMIPALTLFPLNFPTGRPPTPRWRWVQWVALAALPLNFVGEAFPPGTFAEYPVENPVGANGAWRTVVDVCAVLGTVAMALALVASTVSLVVRFRRSRGEERQQIKWVATAAVLLVFLFLFPIQKVVGEDAGFAILLAALLVVATAVAISILRYRLYDIDVVINRALVYGSLTATLLVVYVGSVLLLQLALSGLTQGSGLAVAASTLAVAGLFGPARARIQRTVDRRFFRSRYDARRTLERFAARLRDEVDLGELSADLRTVVVETMRPAHVTLWLRDVERSG